MAAPDGNDSSVLIDLAAIRAAEPHFHWLVMRLAQLDPSAPAVGETTAPAREGLRFGANPSLGFPAAEISDVSRLDSGKVLVRVNHLGLFGPSSPLPPNVTERVLHADHDDTRLRDFLDFFNHRLIALSHKLWRDRRHHLHFRADGSDLSSERLGALMGLPTVADSDDNMPPRGRLFPFAGLFSLFSRSAATVEALVAFCFFVPTRVEEFVLRTVPISPDQQPVMGVRGQLGVDFMIGSTVEDRSGKFRVHIGPLDREQFLSFLPDTQNYHQLGHLVRMLLHDPLDWDIALELDESAAMQWSLGSSPLGWASWSGDQPADRIVILPQPPERRAVAS